MRAPSARAPHVPIPITAPSLWATCPMDGQFPDRLQVLSSTNASERENQRENKSQGELSFFSPTPGLQEVLLGAGSRAVPWNKGQNTTTAKLHSGPHDSKG